LRVHIRAYDSNDGIEAVYNLFTLNDSRERSQLAQENRSNRYRWAAHHHSAGPFRSDIRQGGPLSEA
jgi:hypothetical protein